MKELKESISVFMNMGLEKRHRLKNRLVGGKASVKGSDGVGKACDKW